MDKLSRYRETVLIVLKRHGQYNPSHGAIETLTIADIISDNYVLLDVGWDRPGRVHAIILHIRIKDEKIWIEWDGIEDGVTNELLELGIKQDDIIYGGTESRKLYQLLPIG